MQKKIGYIVFAILFVAAAVYAVFSLVPEKKPVAENTCLVGITEGEGFTVLSENPVRAVFGEKATFRVRLEEGYVFTDLCGGTLSGEELVFSSVTEEKNYNLRARQGKTLPVVTCIAEGRGRLELLTEGAYLPGDALSFRVTAEEHYLLLGITLNGETYPLPAGAEFSMTMPDEDLTVKAQFAGEERLFFAVSDGGGRAEISEPRSLYRYGDVLSVSAVFDAAQTDFCGWTANASLLAGGGLLSEEPVFSLTLTENLRLYANFRKKTVFSLRFDANGGTCAALPAECKYGEKDAVSIEKDDGNFTKTGCRLVCFTAAADGSGKEYYPGSVFVMPDRDVTLYAQYVAILPEDFFTVRSLEGGTVAITGFSGKGNAAKPEKLVFPDAIKGKTVTAIWENAFKANAFVREVYLPRQVQSVNASAFSDCPLLKKVEFPETLTDIHYTAFYHCPEFSDFRVHVTLDKVFDEDYDSAQADKYLRLIRTNEKNRIVLVGGSNCAFGFRSDLLAEAFPNCEIVNFGTSVGYGVIPILDVLLANVHEGDIVVCNLEYQPRMYGKRGRDAAYPFWECLESNCNILSEIDLRNTEDILSTFTEYLAAKRNFLEKGTKKVNGAVYSRFAMNEYGDNAMERVGWDVSGWGEVPDPEILTEEDLNCFAPYAAAFSARGVRLLFSFPASCIPVETKFSEGDLAAGCAAFAEKLRRLLPEGCTVISDPFDYYMDRGYFFDNIFHLNLEGAAERTERLISDLNRYFSGGAEK